MSHERIGLEWRSGDTTAWLFCGMFGWKETRIFKKKSIDWIYYRIFWAYIGLLLLYVTIIIYLLTLIGVHFRCTFSVF